MNEPTRLVTTKPDVEIAEEFKRELIEAYKPIIAILERARTTGFLINTQVGQGPLGAIALLDLKVLKSF